MHVSVASCQSKFAIHEVMNCVANLNVHLKDPTENINAIKILLNTRAFMNHNLSLRAGGGLLEAIVFGDGIKYSKASVSGQ